MSTRTLVVERSDASDPRYVELYRRLGERPDVSYLRKITVPGARILELGCAAGGLALPLARAGFQVWGVDRDARMLGVAAEASLPNLHLVAAQIEALQLGPVYDVVIASSHLVNTMDATLRAAFFKAAVDHLSPTGIAVFEIIRPDWVMPGAVLETGEVRIECDSLDSGGIWRGRVIYRFDDGEFAEELADTVLDEAAMAHAFAGVGLRAHGVPIKLSPVDMAVLAKRSDAP